MKNFTQKATKVTKDIPSFHSFPSVKHSRPHFAICHKTAMTESAANRIIMQRLRSARNQHRQQQNWQGYYCHVCEAWHIKVTTTNERHHEIERSSRAQTARD
jgi:hypothetical protein